MRERHRCKNNIQHHPLWTGVTPPVNRSYEKKDRTNKYFLCSQSLVHLIPPQLIQHTLSHCRAAVHTHWSVWSVAENSTCIKLFCGIISQQNHKEKWKRPEHIPQFDGSDGAPRWDLTLDVWIFPQNCSTFVCNSLLNVFERAYFVRQKHVVNFGTYDIATL